MILTREISIKVTEFNFNFFENIGYDDISIGEIVNIPISLLSHGSNHKILCKCDSCGIEKEIIYKNYMKYGNEWGFYDCRKCSESKRKETLKRNWGCEYPIQNKKILTKMRKTIIDRRDLKLNNSDDLTID